MGFTRKLEARDAGLTAVFAALYVVLSFLPLSQVIGFFGKSITVATVVAPVIGLILGAYLGLFSTSLGGIISLFVSQNFSLPSLLAGAIAALCAGLLYRGKQSFCVVVYVLLLIFYGFYPFIGAFWLYPSVMWFQILGLIVLISPLQSIASRNFNSNSNSRLLFAFFITSLTSTLASQIAGSLAFEILFPDPDFLRGVWQVTTFIYPIERVFIAVAAALIGASLYKTLKPANIMSLNKKSTKA
jgi:hypothetical protein